ncbi:MAG: hypothetical protein HKP38_00960 [Croceitalea sp.]|nr:hypothetical protein [Croceitalea sp.]MBT8238739.1 hypothetical protein [Croceitalea sp.]NNC33954.1 hypothetical protein [Croceitalea sp.]NNL07772.1 hypothetical protein [Croceitalea sp.]NNM18905.1 hypothetical protein [Croceitalea sp.]
MKNKLGILCVLCVTLIFNGCDIKTGENFYFVSLKITSAAVPESFDFNSTHNIQITYERPDNCTYFQGFEVISENDGVRNIVAIGSELTDQTCETTNDSITAIYTMKAIYSGTYILRFYSGEDLNGDPTYLEYEVPVTMNN